MPVFLITPKSNGMLRGIKIVKLLREHLTLIIANFIAIYLTISGWNYYDVRYFIAWYKEYFTTGKILEIYTSDLKVAYPPLAVLTFVLPHSIAITLSPDNIIVWRIVDKLPLLISFNVAYFLLRRNFDRFTANLWLLNLVSYSVINSFQFDLIPALFVLLAILSIRKSYSLYGFYSTLASLVKHSIAPILLLPIIELLKKRAHRELVKYMTVIISVAGVAVFPFFVLNPWSFIEKVLLFHAKRPPQQLSIWAIPAYMAKYELSVVPGWLSDLWITLFGAFMAWTLYLFYKEHVKNHAELTCTYARYIVILIAGFLLLSKVSNINYFLWLTPPLIVFINHVKERDYTLAKRLVKLYVFTSFIITILFGFLTVFVQVVAGYPIFIFEDWNWIPADEFFIRGYAYEPFNTAYLIMLYFRSVPALREICKSLAITHNYFLALLCVMYAYALCYIIHSAIKKPSTNIM